MSLFPFIDADDAPEPIKASQRAEIEPGDDAVKLAPRMASAALAKLKRAGKLPKRYSLKVTVKVTPR